MGGVLAAALAVWMTITSAYPAVPPAVFSVRPADQSYGIAWYTGNDAQGRARIAFLEGVMPEPWMLWHEAGHALYTRAFELRGGDDALERYWEARGFPGTPDEALRRAIASGQVPGVSDMQAQWLYWRGSPQESWAEAFTAVNVSGYQERTENYGRPLDIPRMRAFFSTIAAEAPRGVAPRSPGAGERAPLRSLAPLPTRAPVSSAGPAPSVSAPPALNAPGSGRRGAAHDPARTPLPTARVGR